MRGDRLKAPPPLCWRNARAARSWAVLILGSLAALASGVAAEPAYVTEQLQIGIHESRSADSVILELVPSGTKLEVLERDGALARVELDDGTTGWVDASYLSVTPPPGARVEDLEATLRVQEATLQAQETTLQAQETMLQVQETTLQEQETALQEQETTLQEQETALHEQEAMLQAQEATLQAQKAMLQEQETALQEQDATLQEQDATLQEQEAMLQAQEATLQEQEAKRQAQETTLREQETMLQDHEATLQDRKTTIQDQTREFERARQLMQELEQALELEQARAGAAEERTSAVELLLSQATLSLEEIKAASASGEDPPLQLTTETLRELQHVAEENQRLKQELAELDAMQAMAAEQLEAMQTEAAPVETPPSPQPRGESTLDRYKAILGWHPWQWILLASGLLFSFAVGAYLVDWSARRRHGGSRV